MGGLCTEDGQRVYDRGFQPWVHLTIRRGTFKVINRRAKYICIYFISKYLHMSVNIQKSLYAYC